MKIQGGGVGSRRFAFLCKHPVKPRLLGESPLGLPGLIMTADARRRRMFASLRRNSSARDASVFALFCVFLPSNHVFGRTGNAPSRSGFELRPPSTAAVIASPIEIVGTAQFPERFTLSLDLASQATSAFTITRVQLAAPRKAAGDATQEIRLTAVAFDLGPQIFPSLVWTLTAAGGATADLKSPPVKIDVTAPAPSAGNSRDIRDIKPPMRPVLWPLWLLLSSLLAAAVYLTHRYWPRSRSRSGQIEIHDPRPPHEIALEQLGALDALNLEPKAYYERVSEILRIYLERRFDIPALVLTSSDLIRQMRQAEIDRGVVTSTKETIDRADLVKFAKWIPTAQEMSQDRAAAVEIVQLTAPKPEPAQLGNIPK